MSEDEAFQIWSWLVVVVYVVGNVIFWHVVKYGYVRRKANKDQSNDKTGNPKQKDS